MKLERVDICLEVSMMSSYLALPQAGHLEQVFHIFAYLKHHYNAKKVYDPSNPVINYSESERKDWTTSEFGHVVGDEIIPTYRPQPRGLGFTIRAKDDTDHGGDMVTRRSRKSFLVYLNLVPIHWLSKKQPSVKSLSFGSEFIAMRHCCEYLQGLRYKLFMMGIPINLCC